LLEHPALPLIRIARDTDAVFDAASLIELAGIEANQWAPALSRLDKISYLGAAATKCIFLEISRIRPDISMRTAEPTEDNILDRYLATRLAQATEELPDLPVPEQFRQVFRDWAAGRVDFVEFVDAQPAG
jgi:hypothetical protein